MLRCWVLGGAMIAASGCETSQIMTDALTGVALREEEIALRGPITVGENFQGRSVRSVRLPADDPLVERLNDWAKRSLVGAGANIVNVAPGLTVVGANFKLNFSETWVVLDLWNEKGPLGSWFVSMKPDGAPVLEELRQRLGSCSGE
ncbi:MAG: hypothetical protein U0570_04575 [Phycisphaerales bacterium]